MYNRLDNKANPKIKFTVELRLIERKLTESYPKDKLSYSKGGGKFSGSERNWRFEIQEPITSRLR